MIKSALLDSPRISHAFFTRKNGVSKGVYAGLNCGAGSDDVPENVQRNKEIALDQLKLENGRLKTLYQVHSATVIHIASETDLETTFQADAMVTSEPGIALGILTADCVPILFADLDSGVIGAAHSGWKGTLHNIGANVISEMINLGADRKNIRVSVGPAIQQASYEVGPDFPNQFLDISKDYGQYFVPSINDGHFMFDLTGFVRDALERENPHSVELLNHDTYDDEERFYSYRRMTHRKEPDYGRQLSAIALQK